MRRYGNLYHLVWDFDNLWLAARQAQKGKRFKSSCRNFNLDLERNLLTLKRELQEKTYRPGPYRHFKIYEPKERLISAAPYIDRVVHHSTILELTGKKSYRGEEAEKRNRESTEIKKGKKR